MSGCRWLIVCFALLCCGFVNAEASEQWQFVVTPVLWNASVTARLSDSENDNEPIRPDYNFFSLDNLTNYMSLQFEARHGKFSLLFDSLRARYQDERAGSFSNLDVSTNLGFIELVAAYQVSDKHKLDLLAGVRQSFLDIDIMFSALPNRPARSRTDSSDWTDPVIGARYNYPLSDKWQLWLRGDVGGFGVGTKKSINAVADIQYLLNRYVSFKLGYRYLQIEFKEEDFLYEVALKGMRLGVGIHF